jgi:hypothetical protein
MRLPDKPVHPFHAPVRMSTGPQQTHIASSAVFASDYFSLLVAGAVDFC